MNGKHIKGLLRDIRLVLTNVHEMNVEYTESERGVPYLILRQHSSTTNQWERYNIVFFGKGGFFRVFHVTNNNTPRDFPNRKALMAWAITLKEMEVV